MCFVTRIARFCNEKHNTKLSLTCSTTCFTALRYTSLVLWHDIPRKVVIFPRLGAKRAPRVVRIYIGRERERMVLLLVNEYGREFSRNSALSCKLLIYVHFATFSIIRLPLLSFFFYRTGKKEGLSHHYLLPKGYTACGIANCLGYMLEQCRRRTNGINRTFDRIRPTVYICTLVHFDAQNSRSFAFAAVM